MTLTSVSCCIGNVDLLSFPLPEQTVAQSPTIVLEEKEEHTLTGFVEIFSCFTFEGRKLSFPGRWPDLVYHCIRGRSQRHGIKVSDYSEEKSSVRKELSIRPENLENAMLYELTEIKNF